MLRSNLILWYRGVLAAEWVREVSVRSNAFVTAFPLQKAVALPARDQARGWVDGVRHLRG